MKPRLTPTLAQPAIAARKPYYRRILNLFPVAYWPLNEASGSTMTDIRNGYNGVYTNVTLGQPGIGDGLTSALFNGTSSKAEITGTNLTALAAAFNKDEFTIMAWVRVANAGVWSDATQRRILYFGFSIDEANNHFYLRKNTTTNQVRCGRASATHRAIDYTTSGPTDWFHLAMRSSLSGDAIRLYFNGLEVGTPGTGLTAISGSIAKAHFAMTDAAYLWSGYLAHIALFNRALSTAEIAYAATV
jgi:hypothetical protein